MTHSRTSLAHPSSRVETTGTRVWGALPRGLTQLVADGAFAAVAMENGLIVATAHTPEVDVDAPVDLASVDKSVVALLAGVAVRRGLLELDAPVSHYLDSGWSRAARPDEGMITVRQLLDMTSGLGERLTAIAAPGEAWIYNNQVPRLLMAILGVVTDARPNEVTGDFLADPLGVTLRWADRPHEVDALGCPSAGLWSSAVDLAHLGQFVLMGGEGTAGRLIDTDFLGDLWSAETPNPAYGLSWWRNATDEHVLPDGSLHQGPLIAGGPPDLLLAVGAGLNRIAIWRERRIVVAVTGPRTRLRSLPQLRTADSAFWHGLVQAGSS